MDLDHCAIFGQDGNDIGIAFQVWGVGGWRLGVGGWGLSVVEVGGLGFRVRASECRV